MTAVTTFPGTINTSVFSQPIEPDFDSFFDFSQGGYLSPLSSTRSSASKSSPLHFTIDPFNVMPPGDNLDERYHLPGPSHEYDRFRQQTGLPSGISLDVPSLDDPYGHPMSRQGSFLVPNGFHMSPMGYNPGFPTDLDFAGPSQQTMSSNNFLPYNSFDEFVDPTAIDEPQPQVNRLFPGMHSQQAEQAKAEALARRQLQQQQQQQQIANQQRQQAVFAAPPPQSFVQQSQPVEQTRQRTTLNPAVEDKISRLLDQMRKNSNASSMDEDDDTNDQHGQGMRSRKDEDDLDEDERLLASEEGKKLSSKERRQLRNKVSARAFRSRRKEYISQLEGEVAGKVTECNELKTRNRQLNNQNAQLISLTQNLLRHPAFASVLEDMSNDPSILAPVETALVKQEPRNEATHVGMTMVPESNLDFSMLNLGGVQWSSDNQASNVSQVFAVLALPEEPVFDVALLSGKSLESVDDVCKTDAPAFVERPSSSFTESKVTAPSIPRFSTEEREDPSFALYADTPSAASTKTVSTSIEEASRMLENSLSGKTSVHFHIVSTEVTIESVDAMFASLAPTFNRIEKLTAHFL